MKDFRVVMRLNFELRRLLLIDVFQGAEMIRTSKLCRDAKDGKFLRYLYEDCRTIYDAFHRGAKESSESVV